MHNLIITEEVKTMNFRHPIWILALVGAVASVSWAQTAQPADTPNAEPTTQPAWEPPVPLDSVVARFDDVTITEGDLLDRYMAWIEEQRPGMNRTAEQNWREAVAALDGFFRSLI